MTRNWDVRVFGGFAGGVSRKAMVHLRVDCESDTVEEVRALAAAAPDMLAALEAIKHALTQNATYHADVAYATKCAIDAIDKAVRS